MMYVRPKLAVFCFWLWLLALAPFQVAHADLPKVNAPNEAAIQSLITTRNAACSYPTGCTRDRTEVPSGGSGGLNNWCSSSGPYTCLVYRATNPLQSLLFADAVPYALACPANSTASGSLCKCNSGFMESGSSCVPAPNLCSELAGKSVGNYSGQGGTGLKQLCETSLASGDPSLPNCRITGQADLAAKMGDGSYWWTATFKATGEKCKPDANGSTSVSTGTNPTTPPGNSPTAGQATSCPVGQVPGTVNGATVCVPPGPTTPIKTEAKGSTTTNNPDGSTVGVQTTKSTSCTESDCTTTTQTITTTTTSTGAQSSQTSTTSETCSRTDPKCTANAAGSAASGSGSGTGSGDVSDLGTLPDGTLSKTQHAVNVVATTFASGSGCPAPLSFSVRGLSYSISYQSICDRLALLRVLFIAMAGVIAAFILADSFRVQ